jgi:hypothetical protein
MDDHAASITCRGFRGRATPSAGSATGTLWVLSPLAEASGIGEREGQSPLAEASRYVSMLLLGVA